jgi:type VI protein secretion system component Hcp
MKANSLKALACGALATASVSAEAAPLYYLQFDGIRGGVTNKDYKDAIALEDFTWGVEVSFDDPIKPGVPAKAVLTGTDLSWTQSLDISVPEIIESLGTTIRSAEVSGFSTFEFFSMKFTGVKITSFQIQGSSDDLPDVSGVFQYDTLDIIVTPMKSDGSKGTPVSGKFSAAGFGGSKEVFAQLADFSQPVLDNTPVVPVPAALPLLMSGLGCLAWAGSRRKRSRVAQAA